MELKIIEWDEAYKNGGNICFWPHEEIVRFVSKYIRKRVSYDKFIEIRKYEKALDLGCGIGRHMKFLDEMSFQAAGIDLSETAVNMGKAWFKALGKENLMNHIQCGSITNMPYEDHAFDFVVSHGVLDSMEFSIAEAGIKEAARVLKKNGLMYFDVIMDENSNKAHEEIVKEPLEYGTVQLYYNENKINELLKDNYKILEYKIINFCSREEDIIHKRAHIICERV